MSVVIEFAKPADFLNMNDRMHHIPRSRIVKEWRKAAHFAAYTAGARRYTSRSLVSVALPVPDPGRKRDPHNWYPTVKAIVDGLNDADVWPDDDSRYVKTEEPTFYKGVNVIVTITELP